MPQHTVVTFSDELDELDAAVAQLGGIVEDLVWRAFRAMARRHPQLAEQAVKIDDHVDELEREVQEKAILLIARRQPVAADLRHAIAVLKIAAELERIGDLAKSIARRAMTISSAEQPRHIMAGLDHMTELASRQLKDVLDAWGTRDAAKARSVWSGDAGLDALYSSIFRDALAWMLEDPRHIEHCTHLLFAAKNLERIGDHATNIAEQIIFLVTGAPPSQERAKRDDTSSITTIVTTA